MVVLHLLPFPFRCIAAPHLWVFYKGLTHFGSDAVYFLSRDYLVDPLEYLREGRSEPTEAAQGHMDYRVPDTATLARLDTRVVPDEFAAQWQARDHGNARLAWQRFLTEEDPALAHWYRAQFEALAREGRKPEAVFTWCNCPSLSAAAHALGIPVVHSELGALRRLDYFQTVYFDLQGVNGHTQAQARYEAWAARADVEPFPLHELRAIVGARELPAATRHYRFGVPLQVEDDSNVVAFSNGFDNQALLNLVRSTAAPDEILVRSHPASQFRFAGNAGHADDSATTAQFLAACDEIATINSSVGAEALLYGKRVRCLGEAPYAFVAQAEPGSDEFLRRLNFFCLNYLVPGRFLFDLEYARWRLAGPDEAEIRARHLEALAAARKARDEAGPPQSSGATAASSDRPTTVATMYYAQSGQDFTEERSVAAELVLDAGHQTLQWRLPAGVQRLRFDPMAMPGVVELENVTVTTGAGTPLWQGAPRDLPVDRCVDLTLRRRETSLGLVCFSDDPHCELTFAPEVMAACEREPVVLTLVVSGARPLVGTTLSKELMEHLQESLGETSARADTLAQEAATLRKQLQEVDEAQRRAADEAAQQQQELQETIDGLRDAAQKTALESRRCALQEIALGGLVERVDVRNGAPVALVVRPVTGVAPRADDPCEWLALDSDPQFELGLLERFGGQWVEFTVDVSVEPFWASHPHLYFDYGSGYSEAESIAVPHPAPDTDRITFVFYLPPGVKRVRFDPVGQTGPFHLGIPHARRLSRPHAAFAMLRSIAHKRGRRYLVKSALRALRPFPTPGRVRAYLRDIVDIYQAGRDRAADYTAWIAAFEPPASAYGALAKQHDTWAHRPLISIVMPVYNSPADVLREAIESVQAQIYPHWELCIADDASTEPHVRQLLEKFSRRDPRIKVTYRETNGHIVAASNTALEGLATGEFVALLDHDDVLHPLALHFVVEAINRQPDAGLVYSDEDKIDADGRRYDPYFKCDFNYELMLAQNMISHLGVYRRTLLHDIGGFRAGYEGSQDHDLALRVIERLSPSQIVHVPRVLYHWRAIAGSTAVAPVEKPYAMIAARKAVADHLARRGIAAEVLQAPEPPSMIRVRFEVPEPAPLVSIVIPTRDRADLLGMCLDSLLAKTTYPNYEVVIVDNGSVEPATLALFDRLPKDRVRVLRDDAPFNYSALNNRAVAQAAGSLVCLMNNDIEITDGDWLRELVSFAIQPGVGAVGARLWYPDGRLQHGGVILGIGGIANHAHKFLQRGQFGYFARAVLHQSFSAVTAACLVIRKSIYDEVGGLDEKLEVAFNDVDFCLRVHEAGYRNVWTPYAEMVHHESATRGHETTLEKRQRFLREINLMEARWGKILRQDPAYSPNLSLDSEEFAIAWPPRVSN